MMCPRDSVGTFGGAVQGPASNYNTEKENRGGVDSWGPWAISRGGGVGRSRLGSGPVWFVSPVRVPRGTVGFGSLQATERSGVVVTPGSP